MICPTCNNSLIVVEYKQIELDYCTQCQGVWFDFHELELLLESMNLDESNYKSDDMFTLPQADVTEAKRKCPICRKKMKKAYISDNPPILIDVCNRKDGLWFDGGEVSTLIKHIAALTAEDKKSDQHVINFLGDVFKIESSA